MAQRAHIGQSVHVALSMEGGRKVLVAVIVFIVACGGGAVALLALRQERDIVAVWLTTVIAAFGLLSILILGLLLDARRNRRDSRPGSQ